MLNHASGTFNVKLSPQESIAFGEGSFGRLLLDKTFQGDLAGTSTGTMLSFRIPYNGGAAYVAIELVTGELHGRSGTFVLRHSGAMRRDEQSLEINVVPGSGTAELEGLSGTFTIINQGKQHLYEFAYELGVGVE